MATAAIAVAIFGAASAVASTVVSLRQMKKAKSQQQGHSYTYGEGALLTSTNNMTPVPLIYGQVKVAGNQIYSRLANEDKTIYKLVAFCEGPVYSITDFKIDDREASSSKYAGVSYNLYLGNDEQGIDRRVVGSTSEERAERVGGLKNIAYVALQADANENLSSSFSVSAIVKGCKVRVYTDNRSYSIQYSNNPAWCILDFMTRYNGCGMSYDEIDIQSFVDAAAYFNKYNYTLNLCLDEQRSRLDWINEMMDCCRSNLVYKAGKYAIQVEKAESVVQSYKSEDIHDLQIWFSPLDEVPDIYRITYVSPGDEWAKVQAEASNPPSTYLRKQPLVAELTLMGVTSFDQASRLAWFYLNQALTCQTYVEFKTDQRALNRTVGDVIEVTDYITEFKNKKFRIVKIEDAQDDSIKLTCREYNEDIYSEKRSASAPVLNRTKLDDARTPPTTISYVSNSQEYFVNDDGAIISNITLALAYDTFSYNAYFKVAYKKVTDTEWSSAGIFEAGVYEVTIPNMEVFATYQFRFQNVSVSRLVSPYTYSPSIFIRGSSTTPNAPSNFKAERAYGGIRLTWAKTNNVSYELYSEVGGEEFLITKTEDAEYIYFANEGTFKFVLYAVNNLGFKSPKSETTFSLDRPKVTNLRSANRYRETVDGVTKYDVLVTWTPPKSDYYKRAEVWYKTSNAQVEYMASLQEDVPLDELNLYGDWVSGGFGTNCAVLSQAVVGDKYLIAVCTQDEYGGADSPDNCPQIEHIVELKSAIPNTPANFSITFGSIAKVSWEEVTNADILYYELRMDKNVGKDVGLIVRTTELSADVKLTSRKGKLYVYAVSTSVRISAPAVLEYYKPIPKPPIISGEVGVYGNITLTSTPIPSDCTELHLDLVGATFSYDRNISGDVTVISVNLNADIYTVTAYYKDYFGDGETSVPIELVVNPYIDDSLIKAEGITEAKLSEATQLALEKARTAIQEDDFNTYAKQVIDPIAAEITTITKTLNGEEGTTQYSAIVQNSNSINAIVENLGKSPEESGYSAITQLDSAIGLKVSKGDIISSINLGNEGTVAINGKYIHLTGDTVIDGNIITNNMLAGSISADKMNVSSLSAICATIGTLRTSTTGARTEIKDNLITVYDEKNTIRVLMGVIQ